MGKGIWFQIWLFWGIYVKFQGGSQSFLKVGHCHPDMRGADKLLLSPACHQADFFLFEVFRRF